MEPYDTLIKYIYTETEFYWKMMLWKNGRMTKMNSTNHHDVLHIYRMLLIQVANCYHDLSPNISLRGLI
jgi:hypothetical protein